MKYRTRLYLISPSEFKLDDFSSQLRDALCGGDVACFQLRMKEASEEEIVEAAKILMPMCRDKDVAFIINDYPEIAKKLDADGVHIGEDIDGDYENARSIVGDNKIVGVSCYASKDKAYLVGDKGADYVAFGQFYESKTKPPKGRPTPEILEFWSRFTVVQSVAIGGITPENAEPIINAGADFIAVVSGVWEHPQGAGKAVEEYNKVIDSVSGNR